MLAICSVVDRSQLQWRVMNRCLSPTSMHPNGLARPRLGGIKLDFEVGQREEFKFSISETDVERFVQLSGDAAPLHTDSQFAVSSGFQGVVIHGALILARLSQFVGMTFPGPKGVLERMDIAFRAPCYAPCNLKVVGSVRQISEAVSSLVLDIAIHAEDETLVASGKTWHKILGETSSHE